MICSDAERATAMVDDPRDSESEIALKPLTSDSIVFEIAQIAEFSRADDTDLPVEISFCVLAMLVLMERSVCSATMAELLVIIEDMVFP